MGLATRYTRDKVGSKASDTAAKDAKSNIDTLVERLGRAIDHAADGGDDPFKVVAVTELLLDRFVDSGIPALTTGNGGGKPAADTFGGLTEEHRVAVRAVDSGLKLDPHTGEPVDLQAARVANADFTNALLSVEKELGLGKLDGDTVHDRTQRIVEAIGEIKSTDPTFNDEELEEVLDLLADVLRIEKRKDTEALSTFAERTADALADVVRRRDQLQKFVDDLSDAVKANGGTPPTNLTVRDWLETINGLEKVNGTKPGTATKTEPEPTGTVGRVRAAIKKGGKAK